MPREIAILLSRDHADIFVGEVADARDDNRPKVKIENTHRLDFDPKLFTDTTDLPDALSSQLKNLKLGRLPATIVLQRELVEIRRIDVPPVPAGELPALVRMQAPAQLTEFDESGWLDFLPVELNRDGLPTAVLIVSANAKIANVARSVADQLGVRLKRVTTSALATAALAQNAQRTLIVAPCESDLHLVWLDRLRGSGTATVVDLTTTRIGGSDAADLSGKVLATTSDNVRTNRVLKELRRNLASHNHPPSTIQWIGPQVDVVALHDAAQEDAQLGALTHISIDLEDPPRPLVPRSRPSQGEGSSTESNSPLGESRAPARRGGENPPSGSVDFPATLPLGGSAQPGRVAAWTPAIGALAGDEEKLTAGVNLIAPRKPPKKNDNRNRTWLYGSLAAACLFFVLGSAWWLLSSQQKKIRDLNQSLNNIKQMTQDAPQEMGCIEMIDDWQNANLNWVDELKTLSDAALMPDDLIVDQFSSTHQASANKMLIGVKGRIATTPVQTQLRQALLEAYSDVQSGSTPPVNPSPAQPYRRAFSETITIDLNERE